MQMFSGVVIVSTTVMGFGVWGNTAPISGAVIAPGVFVTTGQNKTIQHLEGGVIREIMVREGDIVMPGQLVVQLDDTSPRAAGTTSGTSPYLLNSQVATEYTRVFRHGIVAARVKPQRAK